MNGGFVFFGLGFLDGSDALQPCSITKVFSPVFQIFSESWCWKATSSIPTECHAEVCVPSQEEEERRHQELLAKRKAEEEREKARKQAEAARALELKKEQERERERERQREERERERERQAAAERLVLKTPQIGHFSSYFFLKFLMVLHGENGAST